jgi:hypothetical protein
VCRVACAALHVFVSRDVCASAGCHVSVLTATVALRATWPVPLLLATASRTWIRGIQCQVQWPPRARWWRVVESALGRFPDPRANRSTRTLSAIAARVIALSASARRLPSGDVTVMMSKHRPRARTLPRHTRRWMTGRSAVVTVAGAVAFSFVIAVPVVAQNATAPLACVDVAKIAGRRIAWIDVVTSAPLPLPLPGPAAVLDVLHATTHQSVVRRELLLHPGDTLRADRVQESLR